MGQKNSARRPRPITLTSSANSPHFIIVNNSPSISMQASKQTHWENLAGKVFLTTGEFPSCLRFGADAGGAVDEHHRDDGHNQARLDALPVVERVLEHGVVFSGRKRRRVDRSSRVKM